MLGLSRSPITSDRSVLAGKLSPALPTSRTRTRSSAWHSRLGCALSSRLLRSPQLPHRLQAPGSRPTHNHDTTPQTDALGISARRYMGSVRRGLTSALSPLTPTGLRPLCCFDPNFGQNVHRADVRENSDAGKRTCMKSPTLHGVGTPVSVCSDAVRWELAVAGARWRRLRS